MKFTYDLVLYIFWYLLCKFIMNLSKRLTSQMTHLWPDARYVHRKRTTNMVLKINSIFGGGDRN